MPHQHASQVLVQLVTRLSCVMVMSCRYVGPGSKQVTALQDLGSAAPLEGEDLAHLKGRLAAGAAEALELQLR